MMGVFAEFERAMIRERVKSGLERAKAQGKAVPHRIRRAAKDVRGYATPRLDHGYSRRRPLHGNRREAHRAQSAAEG
jgi:DNA invertase Pin-like site-specific DNA recombinase